MFIKRFSSIVFYFFFDPFLPRLFREEPGKWKLKMEQFKSWLERGKTDPLPEYFGTG